MIPRYILRPQHISRTPTLLAEDLGCVTKRWPGFTSGRPDFDQDFFMYYPDGHDVDAKDKKKYNTLREFMAAAKPYQRARLAKMGLPVPPTYLSSDDVPVASRSGKRFIVRPYHHSGGENYRVTSNYLDFHSGEEYISEVFNKDREYRLLFIFGKPVLFWQKKNPENRPAEEAWGNRDENPWALITDWDHSYLKLRTDAISEISKTELAKYAHIVAFDVMLDMSANKYAVLEANFCPGLTIEHSRSVAVEAIKAYVPTKLRRYSFLYDGDNEGGILALLSGTPHISEVSAQDV